jgi:hypothetical protein
MSNTIASLIAKDIHMNRGVIRALLISGAVALGLCLGNLATFAIGALALLVAVISMGCTLAMGIWKERSERVLLFSLSLPVSARGYLTARTLGTVLSYLAVWLPLTAGAIAVIATSRVIPHGLIPFTVLLLGFLLAEFCLLTGVALLSRREVQLSIAMIIANASVTVFWWGMVLVPSVGLAKPGPVAVWSGTVLTILAVEILASILVLVLPIHLGARKSLL